MTRRLFLAALGVLAVGLWRPAARPVSRRVRVVRVYTRSYGAWTAAAARDAAA
jgi:hypothetical protein